MHNVIIPLLLRGHSLGSQFLRKDIRNGMPAKKSVSSLNYRRMKGGFKHVAEKLNDSPCSSLCLRQMLPCDR